MAKGYVTYRAKFSAIHELSNPKLSEEENKVIFGKCYRTHGHDYFLEVTVVGEIDARSGLCCDREFLFKTLDEEVSQKFNGTHLNHFFKNTSGEALVKEFEGLIIEKLQPLQVVALRLQETPKNFFSISSSSDFLF